MKVFSTKHLLHRGKGTNREEEKNMLKATGVRCSVERLAGFQSPAGCYVTDKPRSILKVQPLIIVSEGPGGGTHVSYVLR